MPYHVQIHRQQLQHLEGITELSPARLADVLEEVLSYLSTASDQFRDERRVAPGSPYFLVDHHFLDGARAHALLFYVNDAHAAAGVLIIDYVEHRLSADDTN